MENRNNTPPPPPPPASPKRPNFMLIAWGALAVILIIWSLTSREDRPVAIDWDVAKEMLLKKDVSKIEIVNREVAEITLRPQTVENYSKQEKYKGIPANSAQFYFNIGSLEYFEGEYDKFKTDNNLTVPLTFTTRKNLWLDVLLSALPFVLILAVWIFLMRGMSRGGGGGGGGVFNVGKAKAQMFDKDSQSKITFKDVAGLAEAKVEIMEIVDFLKNPQKYRDLGGKIPKGALLVGPPGTGKTLLAKAVAGEANVPFFSISGSDFVEMFVGVGASRVRDLFRQAKEKAPCIVFIDEIDAIGRARGRNVGFSSNDERENTLNQLLTEMDGFGTNAGVIVLAATNRADILDHALMRAGRFDRQIDVNLPEISERREIFDVHLKNLKLVKDLDRDFLAQHTPGFSGADIANVCNEAALIAARHNKKAVDRDDFLAAIDRIVGGMERKSLMMTPEEKRETAFHEAGHAIVGWKLKYAKPVIKVTIIPRGRALGATWMAPEERHTLSKEHFLDELASLFGGRAAEEIAFGTVFTGALSDMERATKMAYAMVSYYGMGATVGNMSYYDSSGQSDMSLTKPYSEKTAQEIDEEVKALVEAAYKRAKKILTDNREGLDRLAAMLLEREVVLGEDLEKILGKAENAGQKEAIVVQPQEERDTKE